MQLELLPHGMQRQRENSTRYDGRRRQLLWRVELRFPAAGVLHVVPSVPEGCTLGQLLRSLLEPGVSLLVAPTASGAGSGGDNGSGSKTGDSGGSGDRVDVAYAVTSKSSPTDQSPRQLSRDDGQLVLLRHKLRAYSKASVSSLHVFLGVERRRANDPRFHRLPLDVSLGEALRNKLILEFPTLQVALPGEEDAFPLMETDTEVPASRGPELSDESLGMRGAEAAPQSQTDEA